MTMGKSVEQGSFCPSLDSFHSAMDYWARVTQSGRGRAQTQAFGFPVRHCLLPDPAVMPQPFHNGFQRQRPSFRCSGLTLAVMTGILRTSGSGGGEPFSDFQCPSPVPCLMLRHPALHFTGGRCLISKAKLGIPWGNRTSYYSPGHQVCSKS